MVAMSESFEFVRSAGKAPVQISRHSKDGVTEDFVRRRVLFALEREKVFLPDGSFKLTYHLRKGRASPILVEIYVREKWYNRLIHEYVVYGLHVRRK